VCSSDLLAGAHFQLATLLLADEDGAPAALEHLREAARLKPQWTPASRRLAWILATHPAPSIRNGAEALRFAVNATTPESNDLAGLDTLAAAYAELGDFSNAVATAQLALTRAQTNAALGPLKERLQLYQADKPYRERPDVKR
jgi:predicted Zn-dependent protease